MIDPQKKQKLFLSRAEHQVKQIEFSCREVIALSQQIALFAYDVSQSDINSKKFQFLKTEIKDKLKDFASNIDQIYQILDRKLVIISRQLSRELKNRANVSTSNSEHTVGSLNKSHLPEKETQRSTEKTQKLESFEHGGLFSDTLNPRITQLQSKLAEYEHRQAVLNCKVSELKQKNQKLLEEFNRLSSASSKKIDELSFELSSRLERDKDSFSSLGTKEFKNKPETIIRPVLAFNSPQECSKPPTLQKRRPSLYSQAEQTFEFQFEERASSKKQQKTKSLAFGCMPSKPKNQNSDSLSPAKLTGSPQVQNLDKHDKNRRFDLLLNRLKDSEAEMRSKPQERREGGSEAFQSVFSQNVVKRYQI